MTRERLFKSAYLRLRALALRPWYVAASRPPDPASVRSILVLRFDRIGDMVLATPLLDALKEEYPAVRVTVLASEANAAVLTGHPSADRVVVRRRRGVWGDWSVGLRKPFDLLVDPYWEYELDWPRLAKAIPARHRLGYDIHGRGWAYDLRVPGPAPEISADEVMLELCRRGLGRPFKSRRPRVAVSEAERALGRKLLEAAGADLSKDLVLLHPGGHYPEQRWPPERFAELAEALEAGGRVATVLVGGPSDRPFLSRAALRRPGLRTVETADLRALVGVLAGARLLVCNNSGPLHLARALGVPTLSTLGAATREPLWAPSGPGQRIARKEDLGELGTAEMLAAARECLGVAPMGPRPIGTAEAENIPPRAPMGPRPIGTIRVENVLRVGVDARELERGKRTGIGRFLLNALGALDGRAGLGFVLYGCERTEFPRGPRGARTRILRAPTTQWWDQMALPRALSEDRADVFLSPYNKTPLAAPCPVVVTIHDLIGLRLLLPLARLYARRAETVLTVSEYSRQAIIDRLGVPAGKVFVVPNVVDARYAPGPADPAVPRRYGIEGPYLLYVGNFFPHKNLSRLLRAFASLPTEAAGMRRLVLAGGDDRRRAWLEDEARRLGLATRVALPGLIGERDLPALYRGADILVHPSLDEGFGLPPLEAMACGTPVAAARAGAVPEVVGEAALLFDPLDEGDMARALARVLTEPDLRRELRARGLARAKRFPAAGNGGRLERLLRAAAAGRRAPG